MLSAIDVIIIAKQIHVMLGVKREAKTIFDLIFAIPNSLIHVNPVIAAIGIVSFLILILWPKIKSKIIKIIPAQMVILLIVISLSYFLNLGNATDYEFMSYTILI